MNRSGYLLHAAMTSAATIKDLILYRLAVRPSDEVRDLISKYDDIVEDIAAAISEINDEKE